MNVVWATDSIFAAYEAAEGRHHRGQRAGYMTTQDWNRTHPDRPAKTACLYVVFVIVTREGTSISTLS